MSINLVDPARTFSTHEEALYFYGLEPVSSLVSTRSWFIIVLEISGGPKLSKFFFFSLFSITAGAMVK